MRVTQSMLSNNMLRNLTGSFSKMGTLQEQITSGKKITRPSQDPVVAMKGIGYRTSVDKVEQYKRNLGEASNWLDTSDDTLDKVGFALQRVQELVVQASTDTLTPDDRQKLQAEVAQIQTQIQDLGNTKVGDKFLFSGTKTLAPLFTAGVINASTGIQNAVNIEVYDNVEIRVNSNGVKVFDGINNMLTQLNTDLQNPAFSGSNFDGYLTTISDQHNIVLEERADIGARQNRVDMMEDRLATQEVIVSKQMSDNEDIEYEKTITELISQESVHRASLSVGARIIQPSLMDFLR